VRVQDWIGEVVADVKAVDASPTEGDVTVPEVPTEEHGVHIRPQSTVDSALAASESGMRDAQNAGTTTFSWGAPTGSLTWCRVWDSNPHALSDNGV
jgi:hypothetical protein